MKLLATAALVLSASVFAQGTTIEISGANFRPMPVAVPAPLTQDDGAKKLASEVDGALLFDLQACGLFQVLDRKSYLGAEKEGITASSITFPNWTNVGAESLVKVQLSTDGDTLRGDLRLFQVAAGREDLKVSEAVPAKDARRLAHKLANAVYKYFTKETGPFETKIAFVRKTAGGKDVYLADWDGKNAAAVSTGNINVLPSVAPDRSVAFTSYRRGKPELFLGRPGGEPTPLVANGRMVSGVDFSPDGRRIAYSVADGEAAEIWVANADGSSPVKVTDTKYFLNSSPSWSPDGKRLAFVSNRGGSPQIYVMNADGSDPKRLTFQGNYNQTPAWSPRGDLIAFTARDERNAFDLFTVEVATGKVKRLTQDAKNNEEPSFSPNGRLILFTSTRLGSKSLFVMTFDGNNQIALPLDKGEYTTADWGP
ncbi:MAG: DPP IV N-terminal domain-containing protein [Myxococcaceae bacterium]|jgi:TolB protein|nr:DPP IV N-terminal domain-containing protein [Myxococcaceae bacterium]